MSKIKKIGNSLWVLIPKRITDSNALHDGDEVSLVAHADRIEIRKRLTPMDALVVAANVSYCDGPTRPELENILLSGVLPKKYLAHVDRVLNETSRQILEATAAGFGDKAGLVLSNMKKLRHVISA